MVMVRTVIGILLIAFGGDYRVDCVDIQPQAVEAAKRNIEANGYSDRMTAVLGDIRACRELWEAGSFDLTVSNPPYFVSGSGRSAKEESIAAARDERSCSLSEVCAAAAYLTRWGGRFAMVHRPERAAEVICAMSAAGLEPKRMRTVHSRAGAAPSLILLEGRRGGKPGLVFEPPLILKTDGGEHSEEIKRIYHIGLEAEA